MPNPEDGPPPDGPPPDGYPPPGQPTSAYPPPGQPPGGYPPYGNQPPFPSYPGYPAYPSYPPGWSPPPTDPLVAADFGGWFDGWFGVFRRSFWRLTLIALIVGGVLLVLVGGGIGVSLLTAGAMSATGTSHPPVAVIVILVTIAVLAALVALTAGQGASIYLAVMDAAGRPATIVDSLRLGLRRALPLLGWQALTSIVILIGFVLLIIPGVYLAVVFGGSMASLVVIERTGADRCFELIKDRFWATFGRLLLGWVLVQAYQFIAQLALSAVSSCVVALSTSANSGQPTVAVLIVLFPLLVAGLAVVILPGVIANTAITVVTYAELRGRKDPSITSQRLADELAGPRAVLS